MYFLLTARFFLSTAIICHEFMIILKNSFIIFSQEHCSLYTLNQELLTLSMLDFCLVKLSFKADF